jgi:hypothetical protein
MILQNNSTSPLTVSIPIMIAPNLRHDPSLLIDIKDFMPVVVPSTDRNNILIHSSFSLANLERDAGERLSALVDFIQSSQMASTHGQYIGCSYAIAEQIAYLAYWKDYSLEFRIGRLGTIVAVMAHFPRQSELDCMLAVFQDRHELHAGVQQWFECFCRLVQDHAQIWQIHLIVDRHTYRKLEEPRFIKPDILVEVVEASL